MDPDAKRQRQTTLSFEKPQEPLPKPDETPEKKPKPETPEEKPETPEPKPPKPVPEETPPKPDEPSPKPNGTWILSNNVAEKKIQCSWENKGLTLACMEDFESGKKVPPNTFLYLIGGQNSGKLSTDGTLPWRLAEPYKDQVCFIQKDKTCSGLKPLSDLIEETQSTQISGHSPWDSAKVPTSLTLTQSTTQLFSPKSEADKQLLTAAMDMGQARVAASSFALLWFF